MGLAKVTDLKEMLEDRKSPTYGLKPVLVKRLVEYHKNKGATGDDLVFMKAPKKRAPAVQPVLLD